MSIPAVNLTYLGQPATPSQGQIIHGNDSGPMGKRLIGYGTATLDGAATTFTVNFVDGVQKYAQNNLVIPVQSVTAPATINGVANQSIISGVGAMGQIKVGASITTAGFSNAGNNNTFTVNAVTSSGVQVTNASAVAETNYAATLTTVLGPSVLGVQVARSGSSSDTAAASTTVQPSSVSNTGFTATISAAGSNAQLLSFIVEIFLVS